MAQTVHSIIGRTDGHHPAQCSFFLPVAEGKSPRPAFIETERARTLVQKVIPDLAKMREKERGKFELLDPEIVKSILSILLTFGNIRPRGHAVIGYANPGSAKTTAGHVSALFRLAYIGPPYKDALTVLVHELAHLAAIGELDKLSVLLDPKTLEPCGIRSLNSGWHRTISAPLERRNGEWRWNDSALILKGHFFEEAMAQLVELRLLTALQSGAEQFDTDKPVIFQGKKLVFELPAEYGHSAVGWSILLLEEECPGIVQTLVNGAQGNLDYRRLKKTLDAKFPSLFEALYDISPRTELAVGAEYILRRLGR